MNSLTRRILIFSLFAVIALALTPIQVFSQSHNFRASGPYFYTYCSDGLNYYWGSVSVDMVSDAGPGAYLNYWILDNATGQFETFMGSIPSTSITYSGRLQYGGNYAIRLVIDTSNLIGDQKTGSGGLIDLALTQRPDSSVSTSTGTSVVDRGYMVFRQNGKVSNADSAIISGSVLGTQWGTARFDFQQASVGFRKQAFVTIEAKNQ